MATNKDAIKAIVRTRCEEAILDLQRVLGDNWKPSMPQCSMLIDFNIAELLKLPSFKRDWTGLTVDDQCDVRFGMIRELCPEEN